MFDIDHADIVVTHLCNNHCEHCIDKFINCSAEVIQVETVDKFLKMLREHTDKDLEVLLLGGEPTTAPVDKLVEIASVIHKYGFKAMISTNGKLKNRIIQLMDCFDSIQITVDADDEETINFWRPYANKVNMKVAADENFTWDKLQRFIERTKDFYRQSVCMYFTPDFQELCTDKKIWELLDTLNWERNGSYMYAFNGKVRYKKCIPGETNVIDEPTVPKVYPNGNYNRTWNNEDLDDYIGGNW